MSASVDDHIKVGIAHGHALLNAIERDKGRAVAQAFLAGLVQAAGTWNSERHGTRSTFELLNGLAERAIDPEVSLGAFEADLRETMRRRLAKGQH